MYWYWRCTKCGDHGDTSADTKRKEPPILCYACAEKGLNASLTTIPSTALKCMAVQSGVYFSAAEKKIRCSRGGYFLPNMWKYSESGVLDAYVCCTHAQILLKRPNGYAAERVRQRMVALSGG